MEHKIMCSQKASLNTHAQTERAERVVKASNIKKELTKLNKETVHAIKEIECV